MTATLKIASSSLPPPPPAPRGARWLDVDEAARRSGLSDRRIRQRCATEWFARGLAEQRRPDGGGKPAWYVRDDAAPELARVLAPEAIPFDQRPLTAAQREELRWRARVVDDWEKAVAAAVKLGDTGEAATDAYLSTLAHATGKRVSRRTLYRWREAYRAEGIGGLVDGRWIEDHTDDAADPFFELLKSYWLVQSRRTKRTAWELACQSARERGLTPLSYKAALRRLEGVPRAVAIKLREGESAYVAKAEPSIQRDYAALRTNEQWVGDHHQFDVWVQAPGGKLVRPWLSAWMDMRSRKIVGWCIRALDPNQDAVLSALRHGCETHGVPELLYVDNGKDFDSYAFHGRTKHQRLRGKVRVDEDHARGILRQLGCTARFCWAYHGQSKPIERFFGTLEDRFGKLWPTYCGNSPDTRPENLQAKLDKGRAPKLAEFIERFGQWLESDYHASPHAGDGMGGRSPAQVYAASWNGASLRTTTREALDLLLMKTSRPLNVGKNGVRWRGLWYGQYERALFEWLGKEVYLRVDERDLSRVLVFGPDDRFICAAPCNARLPANANGELLGAAAGLKRRDRRTVSEYHKARPRLHEDLPQLMIRAKAAENAAREADAPPEPQGPGSIQPIRTPLTDQLPALKRAMQRRELRPAVGAESMSFGEVLAPVVARQEAQRAAEDAAAADYVEPWRLLARAFERKEEREREGQP